MQNLIDILEHAFINKQLSKENMKSYKEARNNLMANKSDSKVKKQTLEEFRRIYKADVYNK